MQNLYFRLGLISSIATLALLAALPRIPIFIENKYLNLDSFIGGYNLQLFNGRFVLDLSELKKGLDLEGGIRMVLKADMSKIAPGDRENAIESAKGIISRRVNFLGVSEPNITTSKVSDEYRIVVEIPGVDDISSAIQSIGQTAQLQFKSLASDKEWDRTKIAEYAVDPSAWVETGVTGADLNGVDVVFSQGQLQQAGVPQIQLRFSTKGRAKFSELAKQNIGRPVGLFLDDTLLSAPEVSEDLAEGLTSDPIISGNFDVSTAKALSVQIRAGALPVPVEVLEQKTIGATLGEESVNKSLFAGGVGLLLVFLFMIFAYGKLGIFADFALIIYTLLVITIFKIVPVVLTLPGVAGFVLSIGMASDANILIFERIREELNWGRPKGLAVRHGFDRAWTSIRDSNISSLLTAGVLFYFGTGAIRGFALTLFIGIAVSLFTSIFVTRTLIQVFDVGKVSKK